MVEEAARLNQEFVKEGRAEFVFGDAANLPFGAQAFDRIFTVNTIYFWEDAARVLAELGRVLKKDGRLVIGARPEDTMKEYPFVKYGFTLYSEKSVSTLLEKNGFAVKQVFTEREPDQEISGGMVRVDQMIVLAARKDDN
jgi:ubiquinone/menaquinone biosynthesis C-methylase UbiE